MSSTPYSSPLRIRRPDLRLEPRPDGDAGPQAVPMSAVIATVWRHRMLAGLVAALVVVAVTAASFLVTPLYRAEALLVVDRGGAPLVSPTDVTLASDAEFSLLNTQAELLRSNQVLERVLAGQAARFDLSPAYAKTGDRVQLLHDRVTVTTNQFDWVVRVSLVDDDPELALAALTALIAAHLDGERHRLDDRSRSALDFLRQAEAKARADLTRARAAEADFRRQHGLLSADPDHNLIASQLEALDASRAALEVELAASAATKAGIDAADRAPAGARQDALLRVPVIAEAPLVAQARQALGEARDHAGVLAQKYKPEHPRMVEGAAEVAAAETAFADAVAAARATEVDGHQALEQRMALLQQRINAMETSLAAYREAIIGLQALGVDTANAQQLFQTVDRNLQEEEIASHRQQLEVAVADAPHVTSWPVNVRRSLFVLAGIFLGAIAAVATAHLAEYSARRLRVHQVTRLTALPDIGHIPHVAGLGLPGARTAAAAGAAQAAQGTLDEAFRLLGSTYQLHCAGRLAGPRVLAVTSPGGGDGRSTVAARLAMALAASGNRVLLVDGDLRQPDLQRQFGLKEETGLSDLLQDREAAVVATGHQRLELLAAGAPSGRALELPGIDHFREILAEFAGDNRYIVIDCPPLEFSEATVLCGVADDVLLVVRDQHTAKNTLRLAMSRLEPLADKIMGLVVNDEHEAEAVTQGAVLRVVHTGAFTRRGAQPAPMMGAARRGRPPSGKLDEPVVMLGL